MSSLVELRPADAADDDTAPRVIALREGGTGLDLAQAVRLLTSISWFAWALVWWQGSGTIAIAPAVSTFALLGGIAIVGTSVVSWTPQRWHLADLAILTGTLLIVGLWLSARAPLHEYTTDELTTGQASATVLLSGHNPYGADLTGQLQAFNLPPSVSTPFFGGGVVHTTSYPALSFLIYVPFGAILGVNTPYGLVADGVAWLVLMILVWRLLDVRLRPVVPLIASATFYVGFVDGGVTDSLFLPFLCLAVYRWDRFVAPDLGRAARWLGPVGLGLACSTKPLPWLIAPFLVAAVTMEAARRGVSPLRAAVRYAAAAGGVFALVNAPFIALNPGAWFHGALLPLLEPLIPCGQGIVQLPLYLHTAGGHVGYLAPAGLGAVAAAFGVFLAGYPRTKRLLPLLATVPLLLSSRSLINYFACLVLLMLVSAGSIEQGGTEVTPRVLRLRWAGRAVAGLGGAVAVVGTLAFLLSPAPLRLTVTGDRHVTDAAGRVSVSMTVVASNLTGKPIRPAFAVTSNGFLDPAWNPASGPAVLAPHAQATYELVPTNAKTTLDAGTVFLVDALAADPASVSTSEWTTAS